LLKPAKLSTEEFTEMKKHAETGVQIIKKIKSTTDENAFLNYAEILSGSHHEKWDGSGYPLGLAGEEIPLPGRLMAIVDVYDALTNERPYKKAFPHEHAVDIIKADSGIYFDPKLVDIFLDHEDDFKALGASGSA
jgi:putative two-component system response regulator